MGIPAVEPYEMPAESELPENTASWSPDPARAALLIHDMQRYFLDFFPAGQPPATDLIDNVSRIRQAAVDLGMPVVYTAQPGGMTPQQRGLLRDIWGPGMGTDPRVRQIIGELAPGDRDIVLTKWRYSAFARSDLESILRRRGRDQLIVCGVYAHVGCLMTACDAFSMDIQPFLVADAIADFSPAYHRLALEYAAERCAATVSTRSLLEMLSTSGLESVASSTH